MLYFIVVAVEVGVGKGQRFQDCCPGAGTRDSARQGGIKDTAGPGCSAHSCSWITLNALPTGWSNSGRGHRGESGVSVTSGFSYNQM